MRVCVSIIPVCSMWSFISIFLCICFYVYVCVCVYIYTITYVERYFCNTMASQCHWINSVKLVNHILGCSSGRKSSACPSRGVWECLAAHSRVRPASASRRLCHLGQVAWTSHVCVSSSAKWDDDTALSVCRVTVRIKSVKLKTS